MNDTVPPEEPVVTVDNTPAKTGNSLKNQKRPVMQRLFGIDAWGVVKLVVTCLLVGFFLLALEFDPANQDVDVLAALSEILGNFVQAALWAVLNFWQPLLAGASIVLPLWILWRLISFPFRK
ncbi:hypothetical protein [Henriciella sp.]|uniref:hypothetical protein n=1 Tax=Henriciella sp. TaxID=1968823 RepID=UPI002613E21C|nr:hypothetical protein [Henriciella sp.]